MVHRDPGRVDYEAIEIVCRAVFFSWASVWVGLGALRLQICQLIYSVQMLSTLMLAAPNCCSKASRICFELDGNNCYITFVLSDQRLNPLYSCKKPSPSDRTSPGWWRIKVEPWPSWGGAEGNRYGMFYGVTLSKDCIAKAMFSFWILRALRIPKLHGSGTWQTSGGQIHIADRQSWISWIPHAARHRHVCQPYDCRSCGGDVGYTDMTGLYDLYVWIPQDSDLIRKNCQDMASFMATGPGPPVSTAMIWCVLLCQDLEIWRAIYFYVFSMYFLFGAEHFWVSACWSSCRSLEVWSLQDGQGPRPAHPELRINKDSFH
jgi:hypothetical protein